MYGFVESKRNKGDRIPFSWLVLALMSVGEWDDFGRDGQVVELQDTRLSRLLLRLSRVSQCSEMEELVDPARKIYASVAERIFSSALCAKLKGMERK